jgi:hypothetical protein
LAPIGRVRRTKQLEEGLIEASIRSQH